MSDLVRAAALLGPRVARNVSLAPLSTYRVGGAAALYLEIRGDDDLARCRDAVAATGIELLVVGNGSNLLVAEAGFPGLAVTLGERFRSTAVDGTVLTAGAGAKLPVVARDSVKAGLAGFEWAVGVPGTIGGAVRMNAGGHGSDMASVVAGVRVFDARTGETSTMSPVDLDFGYRRSSLDAAQVVLEADLQLTTSPDDAAGAETLREIVRWRRANQPGGHNAGSVFTNPSGDSAGRLIDIAGCKGRRRGTAEVSTKHANFIQADPDGSATDVVELMREVRDTVAAETGVTLVPETVLVGFDPAVVADLRGGATRGGADE